MALEHRHAFSSPTLLQHLLTRTVWSLEIEPMTAGDATLCAGVIIYHRSACWVDRNETWTRKSLCSPTNQPLLDIIPEWESLPVVQIILARCDEASESLWEKCSLHKLHIFFSPSFIHKKNHIFRKKEFYRIHQLSNWFFMLYFVLCLVPCMYAWSYFYSVSCLVPPVQYVFFVFVFCLPVQGLLNTVQLLFARRPCQIKR